MSLPVTVVQHPLLQIRLSALRDKTTPNATFRVLLRQAGQLLALAAAETLETAPLTVQTPLEPTPGVRLANKIILVPILRAGLGFVEGMTDLFPEASVGHIGLYRDETTLQPQHYYAKFPPVEAQSLAIVVDPMLATGRSSAAALDLVKKAGIPKAILVCLLASPEGLAEMARQHPDVPIFTASVDRELNDQGYILPGLGDAGDRTFGTA